MPVAFQVYCKAFFIEKKSKHLHLLIEFQDFIQALLNIKHSVFAKANALKKIARI